MVSLSGQEPVLLTYAIALGIVILILRMIMGVFASGNPFEYFSPEKDVKTWTVENFDDPEWNSPGGILLDEEYFQEIGGQNDLFPVQKSVLFHVVHVHVNDCAGFFIGGNSRFSGFAAPFGIRFLLL